MAGVNSTGTTIGGRLRSIGVTRTYWLIPLAFGTFAIGAFAATSAEPESRLTLIGCGTLFAAISLLGILWPLLRIRERPDVRFTVIQAKDARLEGILIPTSRVKLAILLIGAGVLGLAGLLALIFATETEDRVKGGIAFAAYAGVAIVMLRAGIGRQPGILLTETGLFVRDAFEAFHVPWNELEAVEVYSHHEKYNIAQSLGFRLNHVEVLSVAKRVRNKWAQNAQRFGWHFYMHAETLLLPLEDTRDIIRAYLGSPGIRGELSNGSAVARIEGNLNRRESSASNQH